METLSPSALSLVEWLLLLLSALLIGVSKAGIAGLGMVVIPLMAATFGGKASTGLVLPMLVMADALAVRHYNRHARWSYLWKLLPASVTGVLIGVWVGQHLSDDTFKTLIAVFVIGSLVLMLWQERGGLPPEVTGSRTFGMLFGLVGGFATMIGNAAGPIMAVYLLSIRLPKNNFIGTGAWFFFLLNSFKVPLQVFVWRNISWASLGLNLITLPAIAIGLLLGIRLVRIIPEREFRYFIIIVTILMSIRLFLQVV